MADEDDLDAQVHRLHARIAHVARALGFGRIAPNGSHWLYSRNEETQARAVSASRRKPRHRAKPMLVPQVRTFPARSYVAEMADSLDPMDRVEAILFRSALALTQVATELHQAAQLMRGARLEYEKDLSRRARRS